MTTNEIIKKVRTFILGERAKGEYAYKKPTFRTVYLQKRPDETEWNNEFKVSCLHGKKVVYMN